MLKKMRWRFIGAAMAAIVAVVLVLVAGMNIWNYHLTVQRQDEILLRLAGGENVTAEGGGPMDHMKKKGNKDQTPPDLPDALPEDPPEALPDALPEDPPEPGQGQEQSTAWKHFRQGDFSMPGLFGGRSEEFRYTLRFFSVECDTAGKAVETNREFIASVTTQEASQWAETVVKSGKTSGYLNGYRYLCQTTLDGSVVYFLNAEQETQAAQTLLLVSSVVAVVGLLVVFVLVVLFSKRAIAPYVRNIETQKRFITDAGHELKTPLTAISASADVLAMDLEGNEWVGSIRTECARMTRLVGDLVTLSRLDEEQPFPDQSEFSLSDTVWEIAEPAATLAKARGIDYTQRIADGLTVKGDRAALGQVVSILLDNALKYASVPGQVRLEADRVRGKVQIQVFNTCLTAGMDVSRLFDRFYRSDASRSSKTGGTGIGLSIAKATVERHGGTIRAKAGKEGITFTVRL